MPETSSSVIVRGVRMGSVTSDNGKVPSNGWRESACAEWLEVRVNMIGPRNVDCTRLTPRYFDMLINGRCLRPPLFHFPSFILQINNRVANFVGK